MNTIEGVALNTVDKLLILLNAKDEAAQELYKLYYIDCMSIGQIIKAHPHINKYTFAKYLALNVQIPRILIHTFNGYFDDVTDVDVFKKMLLNVIDKSYTMARSSFRIGRSTTKIKRVFNLWIDKNISFKELPIFLGFLLFIKNHGTCLTIDKQSWDEYTQYNKSTEEYNYDDWVNMIEKWLDIGLLKKMKTTTKSVRVIIKDYSSAKNNVLPYFIKLLEYCMLHDEYDVYFKKMLNSLLYGIKMRIAFLYVCNVITDEDIYDILFKATGECDNMFKSIIFEHVRNAVDDPYINNYVKTRFKKIVISKKS
jgi:hypothetical protein